MNHKLFFGFAAAQGTYMDQSVKTIVDLPSIVPIPASIDTESGERGQNFA